ncbi:MAG: D-glycero-beta-D-manno-heptose 1-phosphate adenylyltransferase [Chitinophagia bacterium]|jgi:rfaE bifunctional protein nucleotidyltransferase chain/domain
MRAIEQIANKIMTIEQAKAFMQACKTTGKTVAFTNGCFDILHPGHLFSLAQTANEADYLLVGLNSDISVKKLKGPERPINNTESRASILANLVLVDVVVVFEEDTPLQLIQTLLPDVLVKGGDYTIDTIVGAKEVIANGGKVIINPIVEGFSTTNIIEKIKK